MAQNDNKIVGSIILNHKPEGGYNGAKWQYDGDYNNIFVVHTLVVHPTFSKSGIGRLLLNFAESFGLQNNVKSNCLDVYEYNIPAIKLYESCDY